MQTHPFRRAAAAAVVALATLASVLPGAAWAARVGILSNNFVKQTASDFNLNVAGHSFTPVDVSAAAPTLHSLLASFDVLLVFEDGTNANAPAVGNVVAGFAATGRSVVIGTFYDQDRSDGPASFTPHGWGALEGIDPNTTDGTGTPYAPRTLNAAAVVAHPLTAGVATLFSTRFAGGNEAKPGTIVLANWTEPNVHGNRDPAVAYRITGAACVIHIAIAPNYPSIGVYSIDFGGDFYRVWRNAFDFGADHCTSTAAALPGAGVSPIPTLSDAALVLTALLLAALAAAPLSARRRARR